MKQPIQLNLGDRIGAGHGRLSTVSILDPVMWIERTDEKHSDDTAVKTKEAFYRIVLRFDLQVAIKGFDSRWVIPTRNRRR